MPELREAYAHLFVIEAFTLYRIVGRIVFQRIIDLVIGDAQGHDHIGRRMGLGEHVLDGVAGPDIPVRHPVGPHHFAVFLVLWILGEFSLSHQLHDLEGIPGLQPLGDEVDHDVVTGTDGGLNGTFSLVDQLLGVAHPHVGAMGQSRDPHQVGNIFWLCVQQHLDGEVGAELRDTQGAALGSPDVLRGEPQGLRVLEQGHDLRVVHRDRHGIHPGHILEHAHHGGIILSQDIQLQQVVVDAVVVKMGGNGALHIVGRMLDGRKGGHFLPVGKHHDAAGVLSRGTAHLGAAHGDALHLRPAHAGDAVLLVVPEHIAVGGLVLHGADGPRLVGLALAEDHLGVGVGLGLVISRKVQVDIRLLVSLKAQEGLKRNVKAVLDELFPTDGAYCIRHVAARLVGVFLHHFAVEVHIVALGTAVMRRQGIYLGNTRHGSH